MSLEQWPMPSSSNTVLTLPGPDEVVIAIMGATGSGKSSFINTISGSNLAAGHGLRSCTASVARSKPFELFARRITLIDTPGFDDTTVSDTDILKMIALYLSTTYEKGYKLSGIIYMHRISDFRVGGVSRRNFSMFRNLCGDENLKNVVIATNMWGEVTPERGAAREHELATDDLLFRPVLSHGAQMVRYENSRASAESILLRIVHNSPVPLRIQKELVDEGKDITDTSAGRELDRELNAAREKYQRQLAELKKEMEDALDAKDMQTKRELEAVRADLEKNIDKIEHDRERLSRDYAEDKKKADKKLQEVMDTLRREEPARAEREREVVSLLETLERDKRVSEADRQAMMRQIEQLRNSSAHDSSGSILSGITSLLSVVLDVAIFATTGIPPLLTLLTTSISTVTN